MFYVNGKIESERDIIPFIFLSREVISMGSACSCDTDESTFNAGIFSCTVKHMGCFKKENEERTEELINEIVVRVEARMKKDALNITQETIATKE
jgi:hypothetical protein